MTYQWIPIEARDDGPAQSLYNSIRPPCTLGLGPVFGDCVLWYAHSNRSEPETDVLHLSLFSPCILDIQLIQDEPITDPIARWDTTACTTFAIYSLTQHPGVFTRLSEEVHSVRIELDAESRIAQGDPLPP